MPGIGVSIFIGALGAILRYAITTSGEQHGLNIHTTGVILMIIGVIGLILSLLFWASFSPFRRQASTTVIEESPLTPGTRTRRFIRRPGSRY